VQIDGRRLNAAIPQWIDDDPTLLQSLFD